MKRFYLANASETPPRPPVSPSYGYPQDGNRSLNQKPTKLGAYWFHMITEEFMAVIEGAGLEPSETNLHQLADIFEDFRNRATASEEYKIAAEAAAKRAEAAAQGVVTETAGKIKEIQAAGDAQVSRINSSGAEVEQATQEGITRLQSKLQELISNLQSVGGQEASAVRSAAQAILDDINLVKKNVEASAKQAQDSATSASSSSLTATEQAALAKDSAASAKSSESSALASAGAAKNSETASKTSEANAKASEDAAKESAVSAQNSANAAADSVSKVNAAAVLTTRQSLTPEQKSVARENIDVEERYTAQPVGSYLFFAGKTVPEGYLLCNGAAVSRTTYARLFAAIGTTYGAGDGSTTFNLPDVNERFLQGTNALSSVGTKREASLPAISGVLAEVPLIDRLSGAFSAGGGSVGAGTADSSISFWKNVNFNASRSNSAYKGSTVQPPALLTLVAIRY